MKKKVSRVLFADDDEAFCFDVGKDLERRGYEIVYAYDSKELRYKVEEQKELFDLIILDLMMPDQKGRFSVIAGIEDLKFLKQEKKLSIPVIVLSALTDSRIITETVRLGAFEFINKIEVAKNRNLFFNIIDGAITQNSSEKVQKEKNRIDAVEEIEINYNIQFSIVPTSIYRELNLGEFPNGLIKYTVKNNSNVEKRISVSTTIERFSDTQITRLRLKPHQMDYIAHSPVLIVDEIEKIKDIEDATMTHSISYNVGSQKIEKFLNSEKISLPPLTTICWALENVETHRVHFLGNYIAALVTSKSTSVEKIVRLAADLHPLGYLLGYQGPVGTSTQEKIEIVRTQIEAMYNALKIGEKIKFVEDSTFSFKGKNSQAMQRVRLPDESLECGCANCIDGAVLFASLIESAGMSPVIVLIPGHAFVGWEIWENSGEYDCLETTMLSKCEFKEALMEGNRKYNESQEKGDFERGNAAIIDIRNARSLGIYPLFSG